MGYGTLVEYMYNSVPVRLEIIIDKITHPDKGMTLGAIVDAHVERLYINNELSRDVTVVNVTLHEDQLGCDVTLSDATTMQIDWDFADQYGHWEDLPTFH